MKKHIYDEKNGLSYTLHRDYYLPDLIVRDEEVTYGKYGMLRRTFLQEHKKGVYQTMLLTGKLTKHLNDVNQEAREQVEILIQKMKEKQGITEQMKEEEMMLWVGKMNNVRNCAKEIVLMEIVYQ